MQRKEKRDVKKTNRKYRSELGKKKQENSIKP